MAASQLQELDGDGVKHGVNMLGADLQGICVMLSLTAGGNGANNIRNGTRVSKEQTKCIFFFFLLPLGALFFIFRWGER